MTIKELEEKLGVPRATIRFYEKQGLINPQRSGNSYRVYSDEDVTSLMKVIVLRKLGFSVSDIEDFLNEDVSLQELLEKNIAKLQEEMRSLEEAIKVCKKMQSNQDDLLSFDAAYYWDQICTEEKAGNRFMEIANDVIEFEKRVFFKEFELINGEGQFIYGKKESCFHVLKMCLIAGLIWFFLEGMKWKAFVQGFFWPFICILITSILGLPIHFLRKKYPKAARCIVNIGKVICCLFVIFIIILGIVLFFMNIG